MFFGLCLISTSNVFLAAVFNAHYFLKYSGWVTDFNKKSQVK
jgi:hypothetical protein